MLLIGGLLVGALAPAQAKKKKKKPALVQVDEKLYLTSTGCAAGTDNVDFLSITDTDVEIECNYTAAGIRYELGEQTGQTICAQDRCVVAKRADAERVWDAIDGIPITLDSSKPITGSIWTSGLACAVGGVPCSPAGIAIGEMITDITVVGKIGDQEIKIGEQEETYQVVPGTVQEIKVNIPIDAALNGKTLDSIEVRTWQHGESVGHGVINMNGETSSFVSIPTFAK